MLRILELIGHDSEAAGLQAYRGAMMLANNSTDGFRSLLMTIGRGGDYRNAAEAAVRLRFAHSFHVVHAWDAPALVAALGSGLPVVFNAPARLSRGTWSWLATMAYRDVQVVADSTVARNRLLRAGLPAGRCRLIQPAVDLKRIRHARDEQLREELGIRTDDRVVLAPGESTGQAGHKLALHATSILHVLDTRYRLLLWGHGREVGSIEWLGAKLRQPGVVINAERRLRRAIEFEQLLSVADVALVTPGDIAPVLPIALCLAVGLPIVAADGPLVREILAPDLATIVSASPRVLSQKLMQFFECPEQARRCAAAGRAPGLERFDEAIFVAAHHSLYSALTSGAPLELTRS
jgi:glycosyltransferase involved in cell wall biosynthesis